MLLCLERKTIAESHNKEEEMLKRKKKPSAPSIIGNLQIRLGDWLQKGVELLLSVCYSKKIII